MVISILVLMHLSCKTSIRNDCLTTQVVVRELEAAIQVEMQLTGELHPELVREKNDPWGQKYHYELVNGTVRVFSAGADGVVGNADDIDRLRRPARCQSR